MADWVQIGETDISAGAVSSVSFQALDLDERYLLVCRNLKTTSGAAECRIRFMTGGVEYSATQYHTLAGYGSMREVASGGSASGSGAGAYMNLTGMTTFTGDTMVDNSLVAQDQIHGLDADLGWDLYDQGTTDACTTSIGGWTRGHFLDAGSNLEGVTTFWGGNCWNAAPATQIDGIKIYTSTSTFAAVTGARIGLYKYTGSIL